LVGKSSLIIAFSLVFSFNSYFFQGQSQRDQQNSAKEIEHTNNKPTKQAHTQNSETKKQH
jgi:hypothetical protein